jgi:hypothetical protein
VRELCGKIVAKEAILCKRIRKWRKSHQDTSSSSTFRRKIQWPLKVVKHYFKLLCMFCCCWWVEGDLKLCSSVSWGKWLLNDHDIKCFHRKFMEHEFAYTGCPFVSVEKGGHWEPMTHAMFQCWWTIPSKRPSCERLLSWVRKPWIYRLKSRYS